jgi:hypothetical protein
MFNTPFCLTHFLTEPKRSAALLTGIKQVPILVILVQHPALHVPIVLALHAIEIRIPHVTTYERLIILQWMTLGILGSKRLITGNLVTIKRVLIIIISLGPLIWPV